jgi:hypothetical protein
MRKSDNTIHIIKTVRSILFVIIFISLFALFYIFDGSAYVDSLISSRRENFVGNSYAISFYDNSGGKIFNTDGEKVSINSIEDTVNSSAIKITIDSKEIISCGDTVIFAEKGLSPVLDFSLENVNIEVVQQSNTSDFTSYTSISRFINEYKNMFGKPMIVIIQSQLGVPIAVYEGEKVYYEICNNIPKTTRLMIDGKALYIHRANFQIIDSELVK